MWVMASGRGRDLAALSRVDHGIGNGVAGATARVVDRASAFPGWPGHDLAPCVARRLPRAVRGHPPTGSGTIVAPTLLLHGADDELVDLAQAVELAATIAGSRLVTYERTGHFVHWERPDWLARDLAGFVTAGGPA